MSLCVYVVKGPDKSFAGTAGKPYLGQEQRRWETLECSEGLIKRAHTITNVNDVQEFVRNEGGMKAIAALVAAGERAVADAAVHTLWLLARDDKASLRPGGLLGMPGVQLVDALIDIVSPGQKVTRLGRIGPTVLGQCRHAADLPCKMLLWLFRRNFPPIGCHCMSLCRVICVAACPVSLRARPRVSHVRAQEEEAVANGKTADTEVDNDDDAILLLKALAGQDSEVRLSKQTASLGQESVLLQQSSLIMCMSQVFARSVYIVPLHIGITCQVDYEAPPLAAHLPSLRVLFPGARGCQGERGGHRELLRNVRLADLICIRPAEVNLGCMLRLQFCPILHSVTDFAAAI